MSIPVSSIQAPQIVTSQQVATQKPQQKPQAAAPVAQPATQTPTTTQAAIPAKNIKEKGNENQSNMALPKPEIGVINPPQDTYQYSINQNLKEKQEAVKDIYNSALPIASSSLSGGSSKSGGFLKNLLLIGGTIAGVIFAAKKIKLSSIASGNISSLKDIQNHFNDIVNISKKGTLKPFNLKKASVRVIDETADNIKDILKTTRKIASEARNVEGKTPKLTIKLNETGSEVQKTIKEAISKNKIDSLTDDVLSKIEYINIDYVTSDKKSTEVLINTVASKFTDEGGSLGGGWAKAEKFLKDFLGD